MENRRVYSTQAYMLLYIREDEMKSILAPPHVDQIPQEIQELF